MISAPYGSWKSPISSDLVAAGAMRLGDVVLSEGILYATESRPAEGGRSALVGVPLDGSPPFELTPAPFDVRSRVHEYGGGAIAASGGMLYFSNVADGRLHRVRRGAPPEAITSSGAHRYAALHVDDRRQRLIAVMEDHGAGRSEPENSLVALSLGGVPEQSALVRGADFYSCPRVSPDGRRMAWIRWSHPDMPWDGSELWVGSFDGAGRIRDARRVAGGRTEAILQPEWDKGGTLYFLTDASGYWNLSALSGDTVRAVCPMKAELGVPPWVFEASTYAPLADGRLLATWTESGRTQLGTIDPMGGTASPIDLPYTELSHVRAEGAFAVFAAASPLLSPCLVCLDLTTGKHRVLRELSTTRVDARFLSEPRAIAFPTEGERVAYGLFYPPKNPDHTAAGPAPLLVKSHGGPTAAASTALNLRTQYYTSRGVGVLDVDYRGSSGYGRDYRRALDGNWGVADVDDCVNGARFLVGTGEADPERLMITGGSAGGFTTLAALTFRDVFKAGASHYGIGDLEALARDTHKFESRYLERLIGPYPARRDLYRERSPIFHVDSLSCPVIFFQGLEDKVVPPNQAEAMVDALRRKGITVRYVPFPGEHHGFRRAENVRRVVDEEFAFFAEVLGLART